ncbi:hypothetical protein TEA_000157 [Camellia sinensis var. sinensis]|uniref:adenylate kinase n=1 Tax=Camellia sinensis var. sinensis TaxID=542762 RepID=A0A4S4EC03_CAMSN|nr:hypothetical protein TEA_000157 [Camellia sinensis var. sinensis]
MNAEVFPIGHRLALELLMIASLLHQVDEGLAEIVNQGKLVSDEIIINLLSKRLEAGEAKGESGFILDGFPRTIRQALAEIVNQGKLVSDEIIINLLSKRLEAGEAKGESGFILDGFPRTIRQAEILDEVTDIDLVVNLKLPESVLIEKCLGRRICSECGKNFNVASINVKGENGNPGISMAPLPSPPQCVSKLITRSDDTEAVVKERLRIYNEKSQPLEDFYRNQAKLLEFDLPGGIPESWPKLLEALNLLDYHEEKQSAAA